MIFNFMKIDEKNIKTMESQMKMVGVCRLDVQNGEMGCRNSAGISIAVLGLDLIVDKTRGRKCDRSRERERESRSNCIC